ncbi:Extradiol ring-cleavage dioxygenase, class III enzyme, subunit B [Mycena belliarum]|uniref:Extradiol ring-cleavage dioxygenase, class III enzyme, subunit B n=1 Tax=Mycena belliarum TaxID=1033014 RepID=A0AAD6XRL6_9AGAR|nr:Extradiol ring-cleavage dioxygenase, class III enzyme, subunit B [Mycena belliae]
MSDISALQKFWKKNLDQLPSTPDNIPAFFFAHGSPFLAFSPEAARSLGSSGALSCVPLRWGGPTGPLAKFLNDFGPVLLKKYQPKGIVVFSAHWETASERLGMSLVLRVTSHTNSLLVTDYGDENPLLFDYHGFPRELYELRFKSKGDSALSNRVVELYNQAGQLARLSPKLEKCGDDGRGFSGPGLDHGVFVPFRIMFGDELADIPIVQVSIDSTLSPEKNWMLGKTVAKLRKEGILVLSGGLTVHNLREMESGAPQTARPQHHAFDMAVIAAVSVADETERKQAMVGLTKHADFRACHPREEHFVPLYVAAGAGEGGDAKIIADIYGCETVAFGL